MDCVCRGYWIALLCFQTGSAKTRGDPKQTSLGHKRDCLLMWTRCHFLLGHNNLEICVETSNK